MTRVDLSCLICKSYKVTITSKSSASDFRPAAQHNYIKSSLIVHFTCHNTLIMHKWRHILPVYQFLLRASLKIFLNYSFNLKLGILVHTCVCVCLLAFISCTGCHVTHRLAQLIIRTALKNSIVKFHCLITLPPPWKRDTPLMPLTGFYNGATHFIIVIIIILLGEGGGSLLLVASTWCSINRCFNHCSIFGEA